MSANLAVVSSRLPGDTGEEALSERIRRLQAEAKSMAREHVCILETALMEVVATAGQIADGGEAYPIGARELARQIVADTEARMLSLEAIMAKNGVH